MKTRADNFSTRWVLTHQILAHRGKQLALLLLTAAIIAACGGSPASPEENATPVITDAPEATVVPETSEEEASSPEAQSESPLAQPESPLGQPDSPLTTASNGTPRNEEEALALAANTRAQEPSEGLGSLSGVLYSFGNVPGAIRGTQVYLEAADEVDGEFFPPSVSLGPSVDAGDIIVETNGVGQLQMEVPPGNYYMAVWTPYNWLLVVSEPDEESPRLITVEEGDQIDLGVLYVDWP